MSRSGDRSVVARAQSAGQDAVVSRGSLVNRRSVLRGAAVGGTLVWAVPAVQVITMNRAAADTPSGVVPPPDSPPPSGPPENPPTSTPPTSAPPDNPPGDEQTPPAGSRSHRQTHTTPIHGTDPTPRGHGAGGTTASGQVAGRAAAAGYTPSTGSPALAQTGGSGLVTSLGVAGAALVAGGAAAVAVGRTAHGDGRRADQVSESHDEPKP